MPTSDKFIARIDLDAPGPTTATTLRPLKVRITRAARSRTAETVNFAPLGPGGAPATAPAAADVFLRIWLYEAAVGRQGAAALPLSNQLVIELPGFIAQTRANDDAGFEFRVLGATASEPAAWSFVLRLADATGAAWPNATGLRVSVPDPVRNPSGLTSVATTTPPSTLTLACSLETAAGSDAHAHTAWDTDHHPFHVDNLVAVLRKMVHDGGLTCGFYARLNTPEAMQDLADWTALPSPRPDLHRTRGSRSGKVIYDVVNDREFVNAGDVFEKLVLSVGLSYPHVSDTSTSEVCCGSTGFQGSSTTLPVPDLIDQIRSKLVAEPLFALAFPELHGAAPLVRTIGIFTHGDANGGLRATADANTAEGQRHGDGAWFSAGAIPGLASALATRVTDDVLVGLYACWTAMAPDAYRRAQAAVQAYNQAHPGDHPRTNDGDYGAVPASGFPGAGSFAETLCLALVNGAPRRPHAAVMAHTTYGHTYGNSAMRFFTGEASADARSMTKDDGSAFSVSGGSHEAYLLVTVQRPQSAVRRAAPTYHATLRTLPGA